MNRTILAISAVVFVGMAAATIGFSSLVRFKPPTPKGVPRDTPHEEVVRIHRERNRPTPGEGAKAVADQREFNFGLMDPNALREHTFVIRNEGLRALKLGNPRTTCKCGKAVLLQREIPPGETGMLAIRMEPGPKERWVDVAFTVPTSDPNNRELVFHVKGTVKHLVFADPPKISFSSGTVERAASSHEVLVYSEVWEDFSLENLKCSLEGVTWTVHPAPPEMLSKQDGALAGYRLEVVIPEDLPSGHVAERLSFSAVPDPSLVPDGEEQAAAVYQLPVEGLVRGRIGFYGGGIDETGVIHIGNLKRGYEKRIQLTVKIRDKQPELPNLRLDTYPDYVEATLTPLDESVDGLYRLQIIIPADAPVCSHLRFERYGELRLVSDHPRVPDKTLKLRFAVVGETRASL